MLKDRMARFVNNNFFIPDYQRKPQLKNVFVEFLNFLNVEDGGFIIVEIIDETGQDIVFHFSSDLLSKEKLHKFDIGIWVKSVKVTRSVKYSNSNTVYIKYKTRIYEIIKDFKIMGKKIPFIQV